MEYFNYFGSILTNDANRKREIKPKIAIAQTALNRKKILFTRMLDLNLRKKLVKSYIWSIALCGAETWKLRKVDYKYLESFKKTVPEKDGKDQLDRSYEK
jgi:hypothetical protein